jgi:hypothetical protein
MIVGLWNERQKSISIKICFRENEPIILLKEFETKVSETKVLYRPR